jgi:hypothetical protein
LHQAEQRCPGGASAQPQEKVMSNSASTHDDPSSQTGRDGSQAAARLMEITARETEQWRADAKSEADAVVARARQEAADLVRAAREEAERLVTSAREEAAQVSNDARVEAYRVREETAATRKRRDEEIAQLEQQANDHRELMRRHLTEMLDRVNSAPGRSPQ